MRPSQNFCSSSKNLLSSKTSSNLDLLTQNRYSQQFNQNHRKILSLENKCILNVCQSQKNLELSTTSLPPFANYQIERLQSCLPPIQRSISTQSLKLKQKTLNQSMEEHKQSDFKIEFTVLWNYIFFLQQHILSLNSSNKRIKQQYEAEILMSKSKSTLKTAAYFFRYGKRYSKYLFRE